MTRALPLCLAALLLAPLADGKPPRRKKRRRHRIAKELRQALKDLGRGDRPCDALEGRYHDGHESDGFTTVTIARGKVTVLATRREQPDATYEGALPEAMCRRMASHAVSDRLWRVRRWRHRGQRGESQPQITLGVAEVGSFTVRTWDHDVQNQRPFAIARAQFLALAYAISDGKVRY